MRTNTKHPRVSPDPQTSGGPSTGPSEPGGKRRRLDPQGNALTIRTSSSNSPEGLRPPRRGSPSLFVGSQSPETPTGVHNVGGREDPDSLFVPSRSHSPVQPGPSGLQRRRLSTSPLTSPPSSEADESSRLSETTIENYKSELLSAAALNETGHREKLEELGLLEEGELTDDGKYMLAFLNARIADTFAKRLLKANDDAILDANSTVPHAVEHGLEIPGSPSRTLSPDAQRAALDRIKASAQTTRALTDERAVLVLNGYLDPLLGKYATHKSKERIFEMRAEGKNIKDMMKATGLSEPFIHKLIRENPGAVNKYKSDPDPYAARKDMHFSPSTVQMGDRLYGAYQSKVAASEADERDEGALSDDQEAYRTAAGKLNPRGQEKAREMLRMTDLGAKTIGKKFGVATVEHFARTMLPNEEIIKMSSSEQAELAWYLIDKVGYDQKKLSGVTGFSRADVAQLLGIQPGRTTGALNRAINPEEKQQEIADEHQLKSLKSMQLDTGITTTDLTVANRKVLIRNLRDEDGDLTNVAQNFFLGRMYKHPPQMAEQLVRMLQISDDELLQELDDLRDSASSDGFRAGQWAPTQSGLTSAQKIEITARAQRGEYFPYIMHKFAKFRDYDIVGPLVVEQMRIALEMDGAEVMAEISMEDVQTDLCSDAQLEGWRNEIRAAKNISIEAHKQKLFDLGLKEASGAANRGGGFLTREGKYAAVFFRERLGGATAIDMLQINQSQLSLAANELSTAVAHGRRIRTPGSSPTRTLAGAALEEVIARAQQEAGKELTRKQLELIADGYKDANLGSVLLPLGKDRLITALAGEEPKKAVLREKREVVQARKEALQEKKRLLDELTADEAPREEILGANKEFLQASKDLRQAEKEFTQANKDVGQINKSVSKNFGMSLSRVQEFARENAGEIARRTALVGVTGPQTETGTALRTFTSIAAINSHEWKKGQHFGYAPSGGIPAYYKVLSDRDEGQEIRMRDGQIQDPGLEPTIIGG